MEIDANKLLEQTIREGLRDGIKQRMTASYNNPFDKLIDQCVAAKGPEFQSMLMDALNACMGDPVFRDEINAAVRSQLARTLVQRFGGELERQVNALKSDPATRARITVAIEDIVKADCKA